MTSQQGMIRFPYGVCWVKFDWFFFKSGILMVYVGLHIVRTGRRSSKPLEGFVKTPVGKPAKREDDSSKEEACCKHKKHQLGGQIFKNLKRQNRQIYRCSQEDNAWS